MPFPVFDTSCALLQHLPKEQYFNPIFNLSYLDRLAPNRVNGQITIGELVSIAKLFTAPECIDDFLPYHAFHYLGGTHPSTTAVLRNIYGLLPADSKYLIAFCSYRLVSERSTNTRAAKVEFFYPRSVSYYETERRRAEVSLNVTVPPITGDTFITPDQAAAFAELLPAGVAEANEYFTQNSTGVIGDTDGIIPRIIVRALCYNRDANVFYPVGNRDSFPVPHDWASPSILKDYIDRGYRITVTIKENGDRLNFKAIANAGDRRTISTVLSYSANVLDYLPYTIKGPKEPEAPTYGVELEASSDYTAADLITAQKDLFFILKQDGSIYGNKTNAYEMVTVPATLKAHKRLWAEFFEKIDYNKFDTSKSTGNGMHVHIDRQSFTTKHLNRFTWFITNPANEAFMLAISERPTKKNFEEWARMPSHYIHSSKINASKAAMATNRGIRGAVHFKGNVTVEVRMFKGIASYATIIKNLEFVDSVHEYTRTAMLCQLSLKHYLAWLDATPKNKYQILKTFLTEIKLPDMIASSEITDYLWNTELDHAVVEKLNKAPFKVTNAHITSLNKKKRKRTYIMKDGKIICVSTSGGLLAKLDKSMQQRQTRGAATLAMNTFGG